MLAQLTRVQSELNGVTLPLNLPSAAGARETAATLRNQLNDYLLPRYQQWDSPVIVVVGGSTGAGKSTLVNALVGEEVSAASALRPTTRTPVLVHHPADQQWFASSRLLPRWSRQHAGPGRGEGPALQVQESPSIPAGLAIIDAPDIDSLEPLNRERAGELLRAADAWIFATTAMRYADAVPWEYLAQARDRQVVIALVLGRIPPAHVQEITGDLTSVLSSRGLGQAPVFAFTESNRAPEEDVLGEEELRPLREWLHSLIAPEARAAVVAQTLHGATRAALDTAEGVARALDDQHQARRALEEIVDHYHHTGAIEDALTGGELLRGEVLAQWHEFLGTGEYFRRLEAGVSRLRDRIGRLRRGPAEGALKEELSEGFAGLVLATVSEAAQETYRGWSAHPGGAELLDPQLATYSDGLPEEIRRFIAQWQGTVLDLVRTHGASKRSGARVAAFGVNAVGVLLMIVAFASTGGLVGAEVAIAGGAGVVAQRVLEAIFGEHGMRELASRAQGELLTGAGQIMDREARRYRSRLPEIPQGKLAEAIAQARAEFGSRA